MTFKKKWANKKNKKEESSKAIDMYLAEVNNKPSKALDYKSLDCYDLSNFIKQIHSFSEKNKWSESVYFSAVVNGLSFLLSFVELDNSKKSFAKRVIDNLSTREIKSSPTEFIKYFEERYDKRK